MIIRDDGENEWDATEHLDSLSVVIGWQQRVAEQQYAEGSQLDEAGWPNAQVTMAYFQDRGRVLGLFAAQICLELAFVAHHRLDLGISDVAQYNVRKVTARVEQGLVDKADGERPANLL